MALSLESPSHENCIRTGLEGLEKVNGFDLPRTEQFHHPHCWRILKPHGTSQIRSRVSTVSAAKRSYLRFVGHLGALLRSCFFPWLGLYPARSQSSPVILPGQPPWPKALGLYNLLTGLPFWGRLMCIFHNPDRPRDLSPQRPWSPLEGRGRGKLAHR